MEVDGKMGSKTDTRRVVKRVHRGLESGGVGKQGGMDDLHFDRQQEGYRMIQFMFITRNAQLWPESTMS